MRDPNRIYKFCDKIAEMWSEVPDWRFGQLISNLICDLDGAGLYYMEDEELFQYFEKELERFRDT